MENERAPWDKLPHESKSNYAHFCAYRDMCYQLPDDADSPDALPALNVVPRRSLRKLAEQSGRTQMTLNNLSARFRWQERCDAYDLYILELQRALNENRLMEMRARHADVGQKMSKRGLERLLALSDEAIRPEDAIRMIDVGVKIERMSRGDLIPASGGGASDAGADISPDVRGAVEEAVRNATSRVGPGTDDSISSDAPG